MALILANTGKSSYKFFERSLSEAQSGTTQSYTFDLSSENFNEIVNAEIGYQIQGWGTGAVRLYHLDNGTLTPSNGGYTGGGYDAVVSANGKIITVTVSNSSGLSGTALLALNVTTI